MPDDAGVQLELESTSSQVLRGLRVAHAASSGVNPYDVDPKPARPEGAPRLDDIRRLSEWIRLRRDLERQQQDED